MGRSKRFRGSGSFHLRCPARGGEPWFAFHCHTLRRTYPGCLARVRSLVGLVVRRALRRRREVEAALAALGDALLRVGPA